MNIGIISDTHGNLRMMHEAVDKLTALHTPDVILHLGDDYVDGESLCFTARDVRTVPGTRCREYFDPRVSNARVEVFDGLSVAYAHVPEVVAPFADQAVLLLHGHTHRARIVREAGRVWMNPGHLRSHNDRGQRPSFGVILIDEDGVTLVVHELDGAVRLKEFIPRAEWPAVFT